LAKKIIGYLDLLFAWYPFQTIEYRLKSQIEFLSEIVAGLQHMLGGQFHKVRVLVDYGSVNDDLASSAISSPEVAGRLDSCMANP
jgi:hypothetical protein